jgi:hypothetical protein
MEVTLERLPTAFAIISRIHGKSICSYPYPAVSADLQQKLEQMAAEGMLQAPQEGIFGDTLSDRDTLYVLSEDLDSARGQSVVAYLKSLYEPISPLTMLEGFLAIYTKRKLP